MPQFANQGDADRWWGIGQSLGYTGKQDGSGGLGKWLDSTGQRQSAENFYNNNTSPTGGSGVMPAGQVEPLNSWQKTYVNNVTTGAPVTGDMQQARGLLGAAGGLAQGAKYDFNSQPYINQAQGFTNSATQTFGQADADRLMNPWQKNVIDESNKEIARGRGLLQNNMNTQFSNGGAYGSKRQGVYEAEADRGAMEQMARTNAGLLSQGFTNAQGQFNTERSNFANASGQALQAGNFGMSDAQNRFNAPLQQAQTLGTLAGQSVDLRNNYLNQWQQGQNNVLNAGNLVQGNNQAQLDSMNQYRLAESAYPRESVSWYGNALGQFPTGSSTTPYQPNAMQTAGGLGMVGTGLLDTYLKSGSGSGNFTPLQAQGNKPAWS
jgi:hypothetical protein